MEKIINGKRYNTQTARQLAVLSSNQSPTNFEYWRETLYKKRTGEYFLYGEGGGLSKYAKYHDDGRSWGEKIIPLTESEAKKWAKDLESKEYKDIFALEDDRNSVVNVLIPATLHARLKEAAVKRGITQKEIIINALMSELDE